LRSLYLFGKVLRMDMKTYLREATPDQRTALAEQVGSSVAYFYQIAGGHKKAGAALCRALSDAEPRLTLSELRPDYWPAGIAKRATQRKTK
jgi:hypothetical protein